MNHESCKLRNAGKGSRELPSHVPVVLYIQLNEGFEAAASVADAVEMVVMEIGPLKRWDAADSVERQTAIDGVVRQIQAYELRERLPVVLRQRTCEIVCAEEEPPQLRQPSERFGDSSVEVLLMLPDLRDAEILGVLWLWTWHTSDPLPWTEALSVGLVLGCLAEAWIALAPPDQGRLPAVGFPQRHQGSDVTWTCR